MTTKKHKIKERLLADLSPAENNARTHPERQLTLLVDSIREFGMTAPILVNKAGVILAGHARAEAAARFGLEKVPVIEADRWSEQDCKAYAIFDNRITELATWDRRGMVSALQALVDAGVDLKITGFKNIDLTDRTRTPSNESKPTGKARTSVGEIWQAGRHRMLVGDATDELSVKALFAGAVPAAMVTDQPYGVNYDPQWRERLMHDGREVEQDSIAGDHTADWQAAYALFPGNAAWVWMGGASIAVLNRNLKATGFAIAAELAWAKDTAPIGRGCYHWQHEMLVYAERTDAKVKWRGGPVPSIWEVDKPKDHDRHPTQKPLSCMSVPIDKSTAKGDGVYDPFLGTGTTMIAAERMDRVCYGVEIDPIHADTALARWEKETGQAAKRT